jgi:two-component system, OmpR family, response regulator ChvI
MPKMNGFELYREFQKVDKSVKVCFITAFEVYYQASKEVFPTLEIDCFIKKPIEMSELAKKIRLELKTEPKKHGYSHFGGDMTSQKNQ